MAYTFKSRSAASVILLRANGDDLLRLIGKSPAERGVIPPEDMPAAISALEAAIIPPVPAGQATQQAAHGADADDETPEVVSLRQRALPFIELLQSARASGEPVTWGVV